MPRKGTESLLRRALEAESAKISADGEFVRVTVADSVAKLRRRQRYQMLVIGLAAAAVVAAIALPVAFLGGGTVTHAPAGPHSVKPPPVTPTFSVHDWAPVPSVEGMAAKPGTMIYRSCDGDGCSTTLLKPDGTRFALEDVRPDLEAKLDQNGMSGVSLSYDAQWLGIPDGTGYSIYDLADASDTLSVNPGSPGSHWEVLHWEVFGGGVMLTQWSHGRVTEYAFLGVNLDGFSYRPPESLDLLPVRDALYSVAVAEPLDTSIPVEQRPRWTTTGVKELYLGSDIYHPGRIVDRSSLSSAVVTDLSSCMRPGETLAGPDGVPVAIGPPRSQTLDVGGEAFNAILVFTPRDGELVPSGIVRMDCAGPSWSHFGRYDLPLSTATDAWTFLAVMTDGESAMSRVTGGSDTMDIVQVGLDQPSKVLQQLPADSEVLLPGMAIN